MKKEELKRIKALEELAGIPTLKDQFEFIENLKDWNTKWYLLFKDVSTYDKFEGWKPPIKTAFRVYEKIKNGWIILPSKIKQLNLKRIEYVKNRNLGFYFLQCQKDFKKQFSGLNDSLNEKEAKENLIKFYRKKIKPEEVRKNSAHEPRFYELYQQCKGLNGKTLEFENNLFGFDEIRMIGDILYQLENFKTLITPSSKYEKCTLLQLVLSYQYRLINDSDLRGKYPLRKDLYQMISSNYGGTINSVKNKFSLTSIKEKRGKQLRKTDNNKILNKKIVFKLLENFPKALEEAKKEFIDTKPKQ